MTTATAIRLANGTIDEVATPEAWRAMQLTLLQREGPQSTPRRPCPAAPGTSLGLDKTYAFEEAPGPVTLATSSTAAATSGTIL